jgi:hypothetical protein
MSFVLMSCSPIELDISLLDLDIFLNVRQLAAFQKDAGEKDVGGGNRFLSVDYEVIRLLSNPEVMVCF